MIAQIPNPKNENIKLYVNGEICHRDEAKISVFDSVVQGGDAVWEGLRVYDGRIFMFEEHLDRLYDSAHAMMFANVPERDFLKRAVFDTLGANEMRDGVHIRLTLTRGKKVTSGMSPHWNQYGCSLIIIAEWKPPVFDDAGIRVITSTIRRNAAQSVDSKIHHNNLINNILAKIQANQAGVDEAIMLDVHGFVSETNATNIFVVKGATVYTPHADACLPGITRGLVIRICRDNDIECVEKNVSLTEVYTADEMFTTGTMGELAPVLEADGRTIGRGTLGEMTRRLQSLHGQIAAREGVPLPAL